MGRRGIGRRGIGRRGMGRRRSRRRECQNEIEISTRRKRVHEELPAFKFQISCLGWRGDSMGGPNLSWD